MANSPGTSIRVIDSHTGGEPTRVVVEGAPELGDGDMAARRERMRAASDWLRRSLVTEPRGSSCMVGAVLQRPLSSKAVAGVIFFNNVGYLGMCGHGLIGVATTLVHLGRIGPGRHIAETPVGDVTIDVRADGAVSFENVRSFRLHKDVAVTLPDGSEVAGDVAWGGNWFFFTNTERRITLADVEELTGITWRIRQASNKAE